jgi:DNA-binding XRE family transcriptional regulator
MTEEVETRPQLGAGVFQSIELEHYEIHKRHLAALKELQVLPASENGEAIWPRDPGRLSRLIGEYGRALFDAEAKRYPQHEKRNAWLRNLAERTEALMSKRIWDQDLVSAAKLTYHASREEIDALIRSALESYTEKQIAPPPVPFALSAPVESLTQLAAAAGFAARPNAPSLAPRTYSRHEPPNSQHVAMQIRRLRREARLTVEELAGKVGIASRTVQRHEAGEVAEIRLRHLRQYERVFGALLKRPVRIEEFVETPLKSRVSDIA